MDPFKKAYRRGSNLKKESNHLTISEAQAAWSPKESLVDSENNASSNFDNQPASRVSFGNNGAVSRSPSDTVALLKPAETTEVNQLT